jgi:GTP cyclohydrolase IA
MPVDKERAEAAVRELLYAIGEDPDRDGLLDTPARVARMYAEIAGGTDKDPAAHLAVTFEANHDEMVMVKDIPVYSLCEHHMVPWFGTAHVAYIPNDEGRITGLSKIARLCDVYAHRLQVQERFTTQVATALDTELAPKGVMVVVEAEHLCMSMRGVRKPGTTTVTSAVFGLFRKDSATRAEAMTILFGRR